MKTLKNQKGIDTMAKNTITKREALTQILALVEGHTDLEAYCTNEIALLDKKSEKSAEKSAEKAAAYATTRDTVAEILAGVENGMTVSDILNAGVFTNTDGTPMTNQRMTYILNTPEAKAVFTKSTVKGKTYYSLV